MAFTLKTKLNDVEKDHGEFHLKGTGKKTQTFKMFIYLKEDDELKFQLVSDDGLTRTLHAVNTHITIKQIRTN